MKVTQWTRDALASRREKTQLTTRGYRLWRRGDIFDGAGPYEMILDAKVSVDGTGVWVKVGPTPGWRGGVQGLRGEK